MPATNQVRTEPERLGEHAADVRVAGRGRGRGLVHEAHAQVDAEKRAPVEVRVVRRTPVQRLALDIDNRRVAQRGDRVMHAKDLAGVPRQDFERRALNDRGAGDAGAVDVRDRVDRMECSLQIGKLNLCRLVGPHRNRALLLRGRAPAVDQLGARPSVPCERDVPVRGGAGVAATQCEQDCGPSSPGRYSKRRASTPAARIAFSIVNRRSLTYIVHVPRYGVES